MIWFSAKTVDLHGPQRRDQGDSWVRGWWRGGPLRPHKEGQDHRQRRWIPQETHGPGMVITIKHHFYHIWCPQKLKFLTEPDGGAHFYLCNTGWKSFRKFEFEVSSINVQKSQKTGTARNVSNQLFPQLNHYILIVSPKSNGNLGKMCLWPYLEWPRSYRLHVLTLSQTEGLLQISDRGESGFFCSEQYLKFYYNFNQNIVGWFLSSW